MKEICAKFKGVTSGEPSQVASGPGGGCNYTEADIISGGSSGGGSTTKTTTKSSTTKTSTSKSTTKASTTTASSGGSCAPMWGQCGMYWD